MKVHEGIESDEKGCHVHEGIIGMKAVLAHIGAIRTIVFISAFVRAIVGPSQLGVLLEPP